MNAARRKVHGQPCRNCGSKENIDPAHTIPRSLGGRNLPASVIPLCRRCHDRQHTTNDFELLPLMREDEQVEAVRVVGLARAYRYLTRGERS